eukprot:1371550-Amorphochlora_amoeboformis.AAC.1
MSPSRLALVSCCALALFLGLSFFPSRYSKNVFPPNMQNHVKTRFLGRAMLNREDIVIFRSLYVSSPSNVLPYLSFSSFSSKFSDHHFLASSTVGSGVGMRTRAFGQTMVAKQQFR